MLYTLLSFFTIALGVVAAYFGLRLLARGHWIVGWMRGMFGLVLLGGAIFFAMIAFDIFSYRQLLQEKPVATISFERMGEQYFRAVLVEADSGKEHRFELRGDQWQLDARILKWKGFAAGLGLKPGYRLERLGGRYYTLEQERTAERTVHGLSDSRGVDFWQWLERNPGMMPLVDATYGSATYVPMADGALFDVTLSHSGLIARPLNERAQAAINAWK